MSSIYSAISKPINRVAEKFSQMPAKQKMTIILKATAAAVAAGIITAFVSLLLPPIVTAIVGIATFAIMVGLSNVAPRCQNEK